MISYNAELLAYGFAVLTTLAMLVRHERKLKRYLLRSRRRRKKRFPDRLMTMP